jgi:hypothetical protein
MHIHLHGFARLAIADRCHVELVSASYDHASQLRHCVRRPENNLPSMIDLDDLPLGTLLRPKADASGSRHWVYKWNAQGTYEAFRFLPGLVYAYMGMIPVEGETTAYALCSRDGALYEICMGEFEVIP